MTAVDELHDGLVSAIRAGHATVTDITEYRLRRAKRQHPTATVVAIPGENAAIVVPLELIHAIRGRNT